MENLYDVIIIGSGPAGLSAAIYAKRAKLSSLTIEANFASGGQVLNTYEVDNYPGLPGISGMDLGSTLRAHAEKMGAEFSRERVKELVLDEEIKIVRTRKNEYHAKTVILATGAEHRALNVPGEKELSGMGVSYCATCDGAFFKDKTVAVIGGGDVAVEDAIFLARTCKKVYVIHRRDELRAAGVLQDALLAYGCGFHRRKRDGVRREGNEQKGRGSRCDHGRRRVYCRRHRSGLRTDRRHRRNR